MSDLHALSLLPFVPSGRDYEASRRLFADLGFEEIWEHDGYAGFRNGAAQRPGDARPWGILTTRR